MIGKQQKEELFTALLAVLVLVFYFLGRYFGTHG
jgi:hypothetical protein